MGSFMPRSRLRAVLLVGALGAALALPAAVSADTTPGSSGGATIDVGTDVRVTAKVAATIDISFTCDPFLVYDWETGMLVPSTSGRLEFGCATLTQASGRSVISGSAEFYGGDVVCDGTTVQSRAITVMASTSPWKTGSAVAVASIYIIDDQAQSSDTADSGPVAVKLRK